MEFWSFQHISISANADISIHYWNEFLVEKCLLKVSFFHVCIKFKRCLVEMGNSHFVNHGAEWEVNVLIWMNSTLFFEKNTWNNAIEPTFQIQLIFFALNRSISTWFIRNRLFQPKNCLTQETISKVNEKRGKNDIQSQWKKRKKKFRKNE